MDTGWTPWGRVQAGPHGAGCRLDPMGQLTDLYPSPSPSPNPSPNPNPVGWVGGWVGSGQVFMRCSRWCV